MWQITYSVLPLLLIIPIVFPIGNSREPLEDNLLREDIEWSCKSDAECTAQGSTCKEERCECLPGYVYNDDMTTCLRVATAYGDACEETIQCSRYLFTGGKCIENACVCAPGFHYLHGRCYETVELGNKCKNDGECHTNREFGSTMCDNGICKCRAGFYQREYRSCRPAALSVSEECFIDLDCKFNENATCVKSTCALNENEGNYYETLNASFRLTKAGDKDAETVTEWSDCVKDSDCNIHKNAICGTSGKCICKRAHFVPPKLKNKVCVPEIGEPCNADDQVTIANTICKSGTWNCISNKVASTTNQECLKATRVYNNSCQLDEHCYAFGPDAICNNKKCLCNENSHFMKEQQFCWMNRGVGDSCKTNEDCYIEGLSGKLVCTNNVCDCSEGTHLNSAGTTCINSRAELGMYCELDEQCYRSNSVCTDNVCTCKQNYYELKKRCYPGINATCDVNSTKPNECQPRHTICSSGVCTCREGYVDVSTTTCLPKMKYGEVCSHDAQCNSEIPNAICASNSSHSSSMKFCSCPEDRQFRYSECLKKKLLGESCTLRSECYLDFDQDRAICMNGVCTCDWQYVQVSDTSCQENLAGRLLAPNGAIETFSRTSLPILSISLILLLDLIRWA
ncbi:hypothetical protein KPH14_006527 [Odynerus spinipes]|uniref:EGF-like domain-containing protein n=1 Tax=Odynerus spinipes TaxID=1348599 RepID=A0AAD9RQW3_9HYME|nr:hypothetical protein KPH14_006527 [Odynerus spinipes]